MKVVIRTIFVFFFVIAGNSAHATTYKWEGGLNAYFLFYGYGSTGLDGRGTGNAVTGPEGYLHLELDDQAKTLTLSAKLDILPDIAGQPWLSEMDYLLLSYVYEADYIGPDINQPGPKIVFDALNDPSNFITGQPYRQMELQFVGANESVTGTFNGYGSVFVTNGTFGNVFHAGELSQLSNGFVPGLMEMALIGGVKLVPTEVPEPASLFLLAAAAPFISRRRAAKRDNISKQ